MKWFRDLRSSLAQRTMLLLIAAVSGSLTVLAAGFALQRQDDLADFADARARAIAAQVHVTRLVLLSVPPEFRRGISEGLRASGTVYAYPSGLVQPPARSVSETPHLPRQLFRTIFGGNPADTPDVSEAIARYTLPPSEVRFVPNDGPGYWVSQDIDGELWWIVVLAGRLPPAPNAVPWAAVAAVLLALLAVAALYAASITKPLRKLAEAIHRIGDGWPEPVVNMNGPADVREVVNGFNAMLLRLRQVEDERRVLLGGLPHDLRAPLTRLRLRLSTLTDLGEHPGIVADIAAIDRIVRQFIEFLRGVQPDEPLAPLDQIVLSAVEPRRSIGVDLRIETEGLQDLLPQHSLHRLLDNLIENAVQHGREPILVSLRRAGAGFVEVAVTDQGIGIPQDAENLAMEPFTKLDPARGRGGCGLGLAIVRQLVRQLGGTLRFEHSKAFSVVARLGVK
jgi:two-component system, OmpR family, osmolarity sensor histidine kinase EnvZ